MKNQRITIMTALILVILLLLACVISYSTDIKANEIVNKKQEIRVKGYDTKLDFNKRGKVTMAERDVEFWVNNKIGYRTIMVDRAMFQELREVYKTNDAGKTWNKIGETATNNELFEFSFMNEKIGFFCHRQDRDNNKKAIMYRTEDGGITYQSIEILKGEVIGEDYSTPEAPWQENGVLYMHLANQYEPCNGEGPYLDTSRVRLKSTDEGKTWNYDGIPDYEVVW